MVNGLLGKKVGMTQVFDETGLVVPVTVIKAGPCPIVQIKSVERDGYSAVQLGFEERKPRSVNKPMAGHFKKAGVNPCRYLREIRVDETGDLKPGDVVDVSIFSEGDSVDVTGVSKGRGFAGVMKRWGFKGSRGSHGAEKDHRHPGSIGTSTFPARVIKGKKMAGRYGGRRVTVKNLSVVKVDPENNLLVVKGAVPGPPNGLLIIRKSKKAGK
ncbi:TPA: 50S ribosomal protein L3 [Candidatus Poribacteria bacterium]|nr:50S ribosomal protein L3 [Candidatus Poribacteria bacterium]